MVLLAKFHNPMLTGSTLMNFDFRNMLFAVYVAILQTKAFTLFDSLRGENMKNNCLVGRYLYRQMDSCTNFNVNQPKI